MYPIGTRIGAILASDSKQVELFGYGTYEGEEIPDENAGGFGSFIREAGIINPKIRLDNGKVVWGCECYWGPEDKVMASIGGRKVIIVDVDEARKDEKNATNNQSKPGL